MTMAGIGLWGRLGAIALIATALWNPRLPGLRASVHLVVLLDESASLTEVRTNAAWQGLTPALADLPAGSRLSLVRFAAEPQTETAGGRLDSPAARDLLAQPAPPRRRPLARQHTDIGAAVAAGLALAGGDLPLQLLLVSDGAANLGDPEPALRAAAAQGVPVLWWSPPGEVAGADAWIGGLDAPRRVESGAAATLTLTLGADAPLSAELILSDGERPLARRTVALAPGEPAVLAVEVGLTGSGLHRIDAELAAADRVAENDRRSALIEVAGPARVLALAPDPGQSAIATSLRSGGWPIAALRPADFTPAALAGGAVLILERIAAADLAQADWQAIAQAVGDGLGLILLGGPGTFGAGGYRHSTLEGLSPLLAEAPRPLPPASVLFAVDRSGSMAQPTTVGASRLELARRAVLDSARALATVDAAGLLAFAAEARTLLPLARRDDQAAALDAVWDATPGGGTRLAPAVEEALALLAAAPAPQRLLVLVTDGRFADAGQAPDLGRALREADIAVVAIAVGAEAAGASLQPLIDPESGRLLRVDDAAELPQLMQAEVQERRSTAEPGPLRPRLLEPLPFGPNLSGPWPQVAAYQVTRPRPGAEVYLTAPNGDPLLAAHFSGTGRVVALPAGLGPWAGDWTAWAPWGQFIGGLVQWTAAATGRNLYPLVEDGAESIGLTIDALDTQGDWTTAGTLPVEARDPAHRVHRFAAEAAAPGRFTLDLPAPLPGRYDLVLGPAGRGERLAILHQPLEEFLPPAPGAKTLEHLRPTGLTRPWSPAHGAIPTPPGRPARTLPAALALGLFMLTLAMERLPWRQWAARAGGRLRTVRWRRFLRPRAEAGDNANP